MDKEIIIKNGKTEITVNEQAISVSAPNISLTVISDGNSTSVTIVTKNEIQSQVDIGQMSRVGCSAFNY